MRASTIFLILLFGLLVGCAEVDVTKTAKGLMEARGKTSTLSREFRNILKEVDGKTTVGVLQQKIAKLPEPKLIEVLSKLEKDGYVREFAQARQTVGPPSQSPVPPGDGEDLDFTQTVGKPFKPDEQQTLAEEMLTGRALIQRVVNIDVLARRKCHGA